MKITVTPLHIEKGRRGDCKSCPIALAVAPHFPGTDVSVTRFNVYLNGREHALCDKGRQFVHLFDTGCDVEPFTFELEVEDM